MRIRIDGGSVGSGERVRGQGRLGMRMRVRAEDGCFYVF